jgi:hypothetical protein
MGDDVKRGGWVVLGSGEEASESAEEIEYGGDGIEWNFAL